MPNTREAVVAMARSKVGVKEQPPNSNRTEFGRWYGFNGVYWCAIFTSWVVAMVGNKSGYRFASTAASVAWARRNNRLRPVRDARPGDIVVHLYTSSTGHDGVVVANEGGGVLLTVEGNTGGSDRDGGAVMERRRSTFWQYCIGLDYDDVVTVPAPTPAPPVGRPAFPGRVLEVGVRGEDVRTWQQKMKDRGWRRMSVDGAYGPISADLCRQFQHEKSLFVDGKVGPNTWAATWR